MPLPKDVFDDPGKYLEFLTASSDTDFEDQHFDRKEACRADGTGTVSSSRLSGLRDQIIECISAFANENKQGGLLVLGISSAGTIEGVNLLSEKQLNSLTDFNQLLVHHGAKAKLFSCPNKSGAVDQICLIHVSYAERHLCETPGNSPRAWVRQGRQNIAIDDQHRERIKREKGIVEFEKTYCCPFEPSDLDPDVVEQFRASFLAAYQRVVQH